MTTESYSFRLLFFLHRSFRYHLLILHLQLLIIQFDTFYRWQISLQFFSLFNITTLSFRGANFVFSL